MVKVGGHDGDRLVPRSVICARRERPISAAQENRHPTARTAAANHSQIQLPVVVKVSHGNSPRPRIGFGYEPPPDFKLRLRSGAPGQEARNQQSNERYTLTRAKHPLLLRSRLTEPGAEDPSA